MMPLFFAMVGLTYPSLLSGAAPGDHSVAMTVMESSAHFSTRARVHVGQRCAVVHVLIFSPMEETKKERLTYSPIAMRLSLRGSVACHRQ